MASKHALVGRSWHLTYPDRWRDELAALRRAGLAYRISRPGGGVRLHVTFPVPSSDAVTLRVDFDMFPWFPPMVTDLRNHLGLRRHRHPIAGTLCLLHREEGWDSNMTVAQLLTEQIPKLLASKSDVQPGIGAAGAVEVPIAEGANAWRPMSSHAVVVPLRAMPTGERGNLIARTNANGRLSAIVLEALYDESRQAPLLPLQNLDLLAPDQILGEWLRLSDYDPVWSTQELWKRVEPLLRPRNEHWDNGSDLLLSTLRLVGLVVPGEPAFRTSGEEWVFLLEYTPRGSGSKPPTVIACPAQHLAGQRDRSPSGDELRNRHVTIVGAGAVGHHIVPSLARSGVGRLDIIDRDVVDVATSGRQHAPLLACGAPKAYALAAHVNKIAPMVVSVGHHVDIAHLRANNAYTGEVRRALAKADLVVDASANPAVNRYLGALRHATGRPILHVSATAGAWGGVVALTSPDLRAPCRGSGRRTARAGTPPACRGSCCP